MLQRIREKLSYANVMATLAVFIALGGSSYAAFTISGSQIQNNSIAGKKLKRNTLGGTRIKESRLGKVPAARRADRLGDLRAQQTLQRCPQGTVYNVGACVERTARSAQRLGAAAGTCQEAFDAAGSTGGRLPTWQELFYAVQRPEIQLTVPPGELTADVAGPGALERAQAIVMTSETGAVSTAPDSVEGERPYRCATDPLDNKVLDPR